VQQAGKVDGPYFLGWFADYPSPQNFLEPLFSTNGSANDVGYSNEKFDDLIVKGNEADDADAGIEFHQQAEDIVLDQLPGTPLWYGILQNAHGERLTKATFRVGLLDLTGVTVTT
jgi:ABC-type oligopeptide transport system substrate-binding subunit